MKKSNDIGKIGLVIADKQHSFFWEVPEMFGTGNFQFIDDRKTGVRQQPNEKIDQFSYRVKISQPFAYGRHSGFFWTNNNA